jgi:hypothetical protein
MRRLCCQLLAIGLFAALVALPASSSASDPRWTVRGSDATGDTEAFGRGADFATAVRAMVDLTSMVHAYAGQSDSEASRLFLAGRLQGHHGYRERFTYSYAWAGSQATVKVMHHATRTGAEVLRAKLGGDFVNACPDSNVARLAGHRHRLSVVLPLACFGSVTPQEVTVDVGATAWKWSTGLGSRHRVTDDAAALDAPLPAATTDPETGAVTQPDARKDVVLVQGGSDHNRPGRETADLESVVYARDGNRLNITACTTAINGFARLDIPFSHPDDADVKALVTVDRQAETGVLDNRVDGTQHAVPVSSNGPCTTVVVPLWRLPHDHESFVVRTDSDAVVQGEFYDFTPYTLLDLDS